MTRITDSPVQDEAAFKMLARFHGAFAIDKRAIFAAASHALRAAEYLALPVNEPYGQFGMQ